jgi:hypothetical protein
MRKVTSLVFKFKGGSVTTELASLTVGNSAPWLVANPE